MNLQKQPQKVQIPRTHSIHSSVYLSILQNMKYWSKEFDHNDCQICRQFYEKAEENEMLLQDMPKKESNDH